ncbi:MAG TPA: DinB family protein [Pyrinomonadaceae bacterium]|jgi:uncharacterized damage-inducible protein DinB|nr:DinB family protein [Pyrinomonadaceae bacterium]
MNDLTTLRELFRHMEWADAVVWTAVLGHAEAADDTALRKRLHHLHHVQRAFLQVWTEQYTGAPPAKFSDGASLLDWAREYYSEVEKYLGDLDEKNLNQPLEVPWARMVEARLGRKAEVPSLGETLLQVVMHSTYHRGQVNMQLRQLGVEPPLTDFIAWLWLGKPQAAWP